MKKNKDGLRIYGQWAGNERGHKEDLEKCIATVWPGHGYISAQCSRKRGHGITEEYCKQHARGLKQIDLM